MDQYSLDIGFDRRALPKPDDEEHALLSVGFTAVGQAGNPVVTARSFHLADRLKLTVYDLTDPPGEGEEVTIEGLSLSLEIRPARTQSAVQPFLLLVPGATPKTSYAAYTIYRAIADTGESTVFGGNFPSWNVHPPDSSSKEYPHDQRGPGRQPPRPTFEIVAGGHFYFTLQLEVRWTDPEGNSHRKIYRDDPEMIIDTSNGLEEPPAGPRPAGG